MEITTKSYQTSTVLSLFGTFDFDSHSDLHDVIKSVILEGQKKVILDLSQVTSIETATIGMLLVRFRELKNEGVLLQLTHFHEGLADKKSALTLSQTIPTFASNDEALAS